MTKISQLKFSLSGMKCRGSKEATGDEKKKKILVVKNYLIWNDYLALP